MIPNVHRLGFMTVKANKSSPAYASVRENILLLPPLEIVEYTYLTSDFNHSNLDIFMYILMFAERKRHLTYHSL
jgi:hypothetical protein